jgi:isoprenylcysteine carboxyl methyltransferase (ICMT) family protein YpbQ
MKHHVMKFGEIWKCKMMSLNTHKFNTLNSFKMSKGQAKQDEDAECTQD